MTDGYETVDEVLADMKKRSENANGIANDNPDATTHCDAVAVMLDNFRHRIEAAHQHEIDELTAAEHGGVIVNGAVRGLKEENNRLRNALKPIKEIMAYNEEHYGHTDEGEIRIPLNVLLRKKVRESWHKIEGGV